MPELDATAADVGPRSPARPAGQPSARLIAALFVILMMSSGLAFYNLQVFLHAITQTGVIGVQLMSWAIGFFFVVNGVAGLGVSLLLERFSARAVIAAGGVVAGLSLGALGRVRGGGEFFIVFGVLGLGFAATSLIPAMTVVTRCFVERRSVAVSIVSTGLSVGGIAITPLCAKWIEDHGMATVTPWLGLAYVAVVLPLALLFVHDRPAPSEPRPRLPEGERAGALRAAARSGVPYREAVTSRYFIWLGVAYIAIMLAQVGVLQHLYNAVSFRTDTAFARWIIQVLAGASVVGRFAGGFVLLRVPMTPATAVLVAAQGGALAGLGFAASPAAITASVAVFGVTIGNLLMIQPLLLANAFGLRDYGHIYAASQLVTTVGYAAGPGVIAFCFTRFGDYGAAFAVAAVATVVALLGILFAGRPTAAS